MFYDIYIGPWTSQGYFNDWTDKLLSSVVWIFTLTVLFFAGWGVLYLIDSSYLDEQQGTGKIVNMVFHPAHDYVTYIHVNKISIPQWHHVPDSWGCVIQVDGLVDEVGVSEYFYNRTPIGQSVNVTFTNGRIWDSMYIQSFSLK